MESFDLITVGLSSSPRANLIVASAADDKLPDHFTQLMQDSVAVLWGSVKHELMESAQRLRQHGDAGALRLRELRRLELRQHRS